MSTKRYEVTHTKGSSVARVREIGTAHVKVVQVSSLPSKVKNKL